MARQIQRFEYSIYNEIFEEIHMTSEKKAGKKIVRHLAMESQLAKAGLD